MPAYLIIGPSGSGKTTVGKELHDRGYMVIETDQKLGAYYDKGSGEKVTQLPAYPVTQEWIDSHAWNWDGKLLNEILEKNKDKTIFFCGGAHNEDTYLKKFKLRFALYADDQTLVSRLQKREPARWITGSPELQAQLAWNQGFREYCQQAGVVILDANQSPAKIANDILDKIRKSGNKNLFT